MARPPFVRETLFRYLLDRRDSFVHRDELALLLYGEVTLLSLQAMWHALKRVRDRHPEAEIRNVEHGYILNIREEPPDGAASSPVS